jgi:drug/metabolite transporter (DMT)-like permease
LNTTTLLSAKAKKETLKGSLLVLAGASGYGLLSPIAKLAYRDGFSAAAVSVSQVLFGALLVGLVLIIQTFTGSKTTSFIKPSLKQKFYLACGGSFLGFTTVFIYNALELLPASIAIVLLFQFTWMGVVMDTILTKKLPSKAKLFSLLILLGGTLFASGAFEANSAHLSLLGIMWALLSAVSYTLVIYVSGNTVTKAAPMIRTFYMALGSMIVTILCFPPQTLVFTVTNIDIMKWGLLLGFVGVVLAPVLLNKGLPAVSLALGTIVSAIELPVVVIVSVLILNEQVSLYQWLGVGGILFAIALPYMLNKDQK